MLWVKKDFEEYTVFAKDQKFDYYPTIKELMKNIVDQSDEKYLLNTIDCSDLYDNEKKNVSKWYNTYYLQKYPDTILIDTQSDYYSNSKQSHNGDSGLDLYTLTDITIPAKSVGTIDFDVKCQAISSFWLIPRSSISKTPLRMTNSIGLVDAGYRGNIKAVVDNISDAEYTIEKGTRLFQIAFPNLHPMKPIIVKSGYLTETTRGDGGFGSTGK